MAAIYLSAAHKSSGKTTLTLGLCRALHTRGVRVQAFKKGPDYIDPIWHARASGRPSYNLDFHMMPKSDIRALYGRHARAADVAVIEGNKGLYDGVDLEGGNSNAALAKLLGVPVVLVLDCVGMTRGIAPLLLGYQAFDPAVDIVGVILNKVGGPRHEEKLRAVVARYTDLPVLGAVRQDAAMSIAERHLGLIPGNEAEQADARIDAIAAAVAAQVDLDALLALAGSARPEPADLRQPPMPDCGGLRLGYALDRAFGFYYQDDLDELRARGVELVPLDMLRDRTLPQIDGLLLGGGFPEMFMDELAANADLRAAVRAAIEQGLPVYAECGGLMYLARALVWGERVAPMVGVIPGDAVMGARPVGRGYALLEPTESTSARPLPAHEFHYSNLTNLDPGLQYAYRVRRGHGVDGRNDGIVYRNLLASYCHRRGCGDDGWIDPFLARMRAWRAQRPPAATRLAA